MKEVLRTSDPVRLSYAMALLEDAGCHPAAPDRYGNASLSRAIFVPDDCEALARQALKALDM